MITNPESVFRFCNSLALAGWLLLVFLGRKRWVSGLVTGVIVPVMLATIYVFLLVSHFGEGKGNFNTLAGVAALFSNPWLLLAGWVHYLAFDLFVGSWQVRDAIANRISHLLVIPCLLLTFLFGPVGLLLYFSLRTMMRKRFYLPN